MRSRYVKAIAWKSCLIFAVVLVCTFELSLHAQTAVPTTLPQKTFRTPNEAAESVIQAAETYDTAALLDIFGPDGKGLISSADPVRDKSLATEFAAKAHQKNLVTIDPKDKARAVLTIGKDDWPFPIPIVEKHGKWYFDSKQGREEILIRRIGSNE